MVCKEYSHFFAFSSYTYTLRSSSHVTCKLFFPFLNSHCTLLNLGNGNPFLPRKPHGQRSLKGCRPWGCKDSDTKELMLKLSNLMNSNTSICLTLNHLNCLIFSRVTSSLDHNLECFERKLHFSCVHNT